MSQEDYNQGHKDGRKSRNAEVQRLEQRLTWARADLAAAREEVLRYRSIIYRPATSEDELPF